MTKWSPPSGQKCITFVYLLLLHLSSKLFTPFLLSFFINWVDKGNFYRYNSCGLWFTPAPRLRNCCAQEAVDERRHAKNSRRQVKNRGPVFQSVAFFGKLTGNNSGQKSWNITKSVCNAHKNSSVVGRHVDVRWVEAWVAGAVESHCQNEQYGGRSSVIFDYRNECEANARWNIS